MKNKTILLAASIATLLSSSLISGYAYADFGVGAGASTNNEYKNLDDKGVLSLGVEYRGDKFNLGKDGISYDFTNSNKYATEVLLTSKNYGYRVKDSKKTFAGMDKRKTSIDIGGRVIVDTGVGPAVLEATKDVHKSKGYEVGLKLGGIAPHAPHWTGKRQLTVSPTVGLRYQSAKVANYYYGVKSSEATATRKAYKAKSAVTPFVGLEAQANISPHFSVNVDLGVAKRAKSIRNSPLTSNKKYQVGAQLGFTYWF